VQAVFLFATNPLANQPAKEALASALKKVPFIVSFSPFLDESSSMADLVLPDHTYLERWQDDQVTHLAGFACFSVAPPLTPLIRPAIALTSCFRSPTPWWAVAEFSVKRFEDLLKEGPGSVRFISRICCLGTG
jgi:anaerobic selenocysteine-containing dehydrogenase